MTKTYYVSERIKNVFFTKKENLKQYYKKAMGFEHPNSGIKEMKSLMQLELYVAKNRTHSDNIWSEL